MCLENVLLLDNFMIVVSVHEKVDVWLKLCGNVVLPFKCVKGFENAKECLSNSREKDAIKPCVTSHMVLYVWEGFFLCYNKPWEYGFGNKHTYMWYGHTQVCYTLIRHPCVPRVFVVWINKYTPVCDGYTPVDFWGNLRITT